MKKYFVTGMLLLSGLVCFAQQTVPVLPATKNRFVVIAHRGNHVAVPENTVAAIEQAILCGADYVEIDLRTTLDSQLVLMHDDKVDRATTGKGAVNTLTFEQIRAMQVKASGQQLYQVPSFAEALQACKGKINIYLDFKAADAAVAYQQIKSAGMENQVIVYLNQREQYKPWQKAAPLMPLMTSLPPEAGTPETLAYVLDRYKICAFDNITDSALLAITRAKNVAVWLDAQHDKEGPASWKEAMGKGIQGLQTDNPAALVSYLKENGLRDGIQTK